MPRPLRAELFDPNVVGIVHGIPRYVRRAFLAVEDPVSGKNYEFRREWIRARLESPRTDPDIGPSQRLPFRKCIGIKGLRIPRPLRWGVLSVPRYGKFA
jgi:hypothetical protein